MNTSCYLVLNKRGAVSVNRVRPPKLNVEEVAIRLNIHIPDEVWRRIIPSVDISIEYDEAFLRPEINVVVEGDIRPPE